MSVVAHPPDAGELARESAAAAPTNAQRDAASQLVGARALALPGIGSVLVAGPIVAALGVGDTTATTGTEVNTGAGSLAGVLVG